MNIIAEYTSTRLAAEAGANVELELRIKSVDQSTLSTLYQKVVAGLLPSLGVSRTVQIITPLVKKEQRRPVHGGMKSLRNVHIRNREFTEQGGIVKPGAVSYSTKQSTFRQVVPGKLTHIISIAIEQPAAEYKPDLTSTVRFKLRASFTLAPGWRLDLTIVRQGSLSGVGPSRDDIIRDLFLHPEQSFLLGNAGATSYEIEAEYVGVHPQTEPLTAPSWEGAAAALFQLVDDKYSSNMEREFVLTYIRQLMVRAPETPFSGIVNQVKSLTRSEWNETIYPGEGWWVTDKADGRRVLLVANEERWHIIGSSTLRTGATSRVAGPMILDCEEVDGALYVFDCLYYMDRVLQKLDSRIAVIPAAVSELAGKTGLKLFAKPYTRLSAQTVGETMARIWRDAQASTLYECDGLILSSPLGKYSHTANYKWKPSEMVTIDFLVGRVPDSVRNSIPFNRTFGKGEDLYVLFVKTDSVQRETLGMGKLPNLEEYNLPPIVSRRGMVEYEHVPFSPAAWPMAYLWSGPENLNGQVVELVLDQSASPSAPSCQPISRGQWRMIRTRADKTEGNAFVVAESNFSLYIDPFPISDFAAPPQDRRILDEWIPLMRERRLFTQSLFAKWFETSASLIDFSPVVDYEQHCNRVRNGQSGPTHLLVVGCNKMELANLTRARLQSRAKKSPSLSILVADLNTPYAELVATIQRETLLTRVDGVFCAQLEYESDSQLRNFFALCATMVRPGGVVVISTVTRDVVTDLGANLGNSPFALHPSGLPMTSGQTTPLARLPSIKSILAQSKVAGLKITHSGAFTPSGEGLNPVETTRLSMQNYYVFTTKK